MKFDLQRKDDLNASLTLVIEKADYAEKLEENLKNYSKKVNIKGFRAGKTPKSVLTKMYGKGMLEETVNTLLNERLFKYLDEEKIEIFGSPMMTPEAEPVDFNPKALEDYTFIFDLGLKPALTLDYGNDQPLDIVTIGPDQAALDEDINRYRRIFGDEETLEDGTVEDHDRVDVLLGKVVTEGINVEEPVESVIDLDKVKGEEAKQLVGLVKGDSLTVDLEKFLGFARAYIIKNTLGLENDPAPEAPLMYKLEITGIKRPQSVELTGEQITKYIGQPIEDEAAFRRILENRDMHTTLAKTTDMKKMAIRSALLKANPFDIPEDFLLRWVNSQRENQLEPGSREANNLFRDAKWSFLLNKISTEAGLEVTDKDIQKQVTQWITENVNYMQTDIRKLMKELYANEYFMSTMKENALEDVVFTHIMPQYQFNEKEATKEEFEHAFHDMHHELFDHGEHSH